MAKVSTYSNLYPLVIPHVRHCGDVLMLQQLQVAGREFAMQTEAFHEWLAPMLVVDWQRDYRLVSGYTAETFRLRDVSMNGLARGPETFQLWRGDTLRWKQSQVPHDPIDDRVLKCGVCPLTAYTDWTGITDGSLTIEVGDETQSVADLDFSGCEEMADVALVLETGICAEIDNHIVHVEWDARTEGSERFWFWVDSGTVSVLTAGDSGTDITGSGYLNGLTGSGEVGGYIRVDAVLRPHIRTDILPDWFLDQYGEGIAAGAIAKITGMEGQPWGNPQTFAIFNGLWENALGVAKVDDLKGNADVPLTWGA